MAKITADQSTTTPVFEIPGVVSRLEQARNEQMRFRLWLGLASFFLGAFGILSVFMLVDWMWVVPAGVRLLALPALAGFAVALVAQSQRPYDKPEVAADAETQFPELGQRVRTVLQYADPASKPVPASPGLLRALARQTDHLAAALDFRKLIPWPIFERRAIGVFLVSVIALVTLLASPSLRIAALRMLFFPAQYTTMRVEPGDLTLKAGEPLKLAVTLDGRPVKSAQWLHRMKSGGDWVSHSLAPELAPGESAKPLAGLLKATLEGCQEDLEYRVVAGELESRPFQVKVIHPLLLKKLQAKITPPPYTRQPPVIASDASWNAIEGSRIEIEIEIDRSPKSAELKVSAGGQALPEKVDLHIDGTKLAGMLPSVTKDIELEITAVASDGMTLEPAKRRIKVAADQAPTVRFIKPDEALAAIPTAEVPVQVEARDDFGVSSLGINFKIGDGPEQTLHLDRPKGQPVTAAALETLYLEKHSLDFNGAITYYAFVEDNYSPKPHRVVSDLRFIDILPFKQDYQLVNGEGSCSGSSVSLEELIARQRDNLNRTFALERETAVGDAAAKRVARNQAELHAATAEFAQGIAAIAGPVSALEDAVAAMQSATAALEKKDIRTARPREEAALKGLIAARQNLRKLLKQSTSSQASACRKFDRQQSQKLRRPPAPENKQELAALEKDLRELARREQKFSEEISSAKPSLAGEQKQAAREAERLNKLAQQDEAVTSDARSRLGQAASKVGDSSRAIEEKRPADAARQAREAARRLESLARQVGALKASELSDRLARERDFAQEIARAERELGQALEQARARESSPDESGQLAARQAELAEDTAALADVLDQIKAAAAQDDRELAQVITQAESSNPPRDVERAMRQNTEAIGSGKTEEAARNAASAAERLEALAHDLESARRAAAGPELERLLAAEREAAALQERLRTVRQPSQQAEADRALEDLAGRIDRLAPGEGALRQAAEKLTNAAAAGHSGWAHAALVDEGEASYLVPPTVYTQSLAAVVSALQAKIQDLVLENALVERTGPVPPQYKDLVENYYRVLSQDLR